MLNSEERDFLVDVLKRFQDETFEYATEIQNIRDLVTEKIISLQEQTYAWRVENYDVLFDNKTDAISYANDKFIELSLDNYTFYEGQTVADTSTIYLVGFDEADNEEILASEEVPVEFEYYHGDLKEHGYP